MVDISWSRLATTPFGHIVEAIYSADPRRFYHTWPHICRGYHHAQFTLHLPYDVNLDLAWLGHDIVYDELPHKELRSIDLIVQLYEQHGPIDGVDIDIVAAMIETSINHQHTDDDRLIMMDLADLSDKTQTTINYELIRTESTKLYECSEADAAQGSFEFMTRFRNTIMANAKASDHSQFWSLVLRGVDQTIKRAESEMVL